MAQIIQKKIEVKITDNIKQDSSNGDNDTDDWSEEVAEIPAGVTDSMLTATDFFNDGERESVYSIAPGEGNIPLRDQQFRDQHSKELAYPGLFLGQKRLDDKERLVSAYYSEICKSVRQSDCRAAMYVCRKYVF